MADLQKYAETINVMPSAPAETKTQSNCTVVCDGQGRYTVTGINSTSSAVVFEFVLNEPFTIPKSVGNGGQGTMSLFNDVSANVNCSFFNGNSYIDGWMLSPANRTHNSYTAQSDKVCDRLQIRIQENSSANVTFSPMFTNDGQYPSEFVQHQTWQHSLRKLTTATEAVENPLYSDGTAITAYNIKGNEEHTGTPTPSNPVDVNGVGERTANLFDKNRTQGIIANAYVNQSGQQVSSQNYYLSYPFYVNEGETYTWSFNSNTFANHSSPTVAFYDNTDTLISVATHTNIIYHFTFTVPSGVAYMRASVYNVAGGEYTGMLLEGSTTIADNIPMPFIPYGYKIPISSGQQTIEIYIGDLPLLKSLDGTAVDEISNGTLTRRVDSDGSVLPTPTTTQITMPSIPTADGANNITVDTAVQPSEFTATWTGWHNSSVKEYDGSDWQ